MSGHIQHNTMSEVYDAIKDIDGTQYGSNCVNVCKKGRSLLFVYIPKNRYEDVISVLEKCNCKVTHEIERDNDIVMRIFIGRDNNSSIYSNGYQKREGQPIGMSATEVFENMISKD